MQSRLASAQRSAQTAVKNIDCAFRIIQAASRIYQVSLSALGSYRGPRSRTWPRQLCIYTIRLRTTMSDAQIAALFDCYSSNVGYAVKAVEDALATNAFAPSELAALVSSIGD